MREYLENGTIDFIWESFTTIPAKAKGLAASPSHLLIRCWTTVLAGIMDRIPGILGDGGQTTWSLDSFPLHVTWGRP